MYGQNSWRKEEVRLKYVLQKFHNKRDKSLWDWEIENLKKENRNMKKLLALLMALFWIVYRSFKKNPNPARKYVDKTNQPTATASTKG